MNGTQAAEFQPPVACKPLACYLGYIALTDMYCEKCKHLFEYDRCPNCRKSRVRPVRLGDPCFPFDKGAPWNGMLADVLHQNDIPFLTDGRMGAAGLATCVGPRPESSRFYVWWDDMDRANAIVDDRRLTNIRAQQSLPHGIGNVLPWSNVQTAAEIIIANHPRKQHRRSL